MALETGMRLQPSAQPMALETEIGPIKGCSQVPIPMAGMGP